MNIEAKDKVEESEIKDEMENKIKNYETKKVFRLKIRQNKRY